MSQWWQREPTFIMRWLGRESRGIIADMAGDTAAARHIASGRNALEVLIESDPLRRLLANWFGAAGVQRIERIIQRWQVNQAQAEEFVRMVEGVGHWERRIDDERVWGMIGTFEELSRRKKGTILSRLVEIEHIFEQRFGRMIRDGQAGFRARRAIGWLTRDEQQALERREGAMRLADRITISDGLSIYALANGVAAYNMSHILTRNLGPTHGGALAFYIHQGPGSKTHLMADLIPYRQEGYYRYRQILQATQHVVFNVLGLPRELNDLVVEDMIDSIMIAVYDDPDLLAMIPGLRAGSASEDAIARALRNHLTEGPFPTHATFTPHGGWTHIPEYLSTPNHLMELLDAGEIGGSRWGMLTEEAIELEPE